MAGGGGVKLSRMPARLAGSLSRFGAETKPVDPFYSGAEWRAFSAQIKRERGFVCEQCGKDCRTTPYGLRVDHKRARKDGGADFDRRNVACLCAGCDNRKRGVEHRDRGRGA